MRLEDFQPGEYQSQAPQTEQAYQAFCPAPINHPWSWSDQDVTILLEEARGALGELNAFSRIVPDVDVFITMHIFKEANTSSAIEGTRTRLDEDILPLEFVDPAKRDDWQEVNNYVTAMTQAIDQLDRLPLSSRLLRDAHQALMQGVRGQHKDPGQFRRSQNWIGGASIQDAVMVPPPPHLVPELMSDLENFWHDQNIKVPHLVRVAISHYQFETIHPFLDGNGRIGRLMIPLYLISVGLLAKPTLYISDYLKIHREAYFNALATVRAEKSLVQWVKFFLAAVRDTASQGTNTFRRLLDLQTEVEEKILGLKSRAKNARRLLHRLYENPTIDVSEAATYLSVSYQTASGLLSALCKLGIIEEITGQRRNRVFGFRRYVEVFLQQLI
jgi:Fic family protein